MKLRLLVGMALVVSACTSTAGDGTLPTIPTTQPSPPATTGSATTTSTSAVSGSSTTAPATTTTAGSTGSVGLLTCWTAEPIGGEPGIAFVDRTADYGLVQPLVGMHAHAAAWGDLDGDGGPDLVVGSFADRRDEVYAVRGGTGPTPDTLMTGSPLVPSSAFPPVWGRTSGAVMADLDGDGDQDVVLVRNMRQRDRGDAPTHVYRNDGDRFTLVELDFGRLFSGRSIGVLDHNRDGLLDLFVVEDRFGSVDSSVLLENRGDMRFEDVSSAGGIPGGVHGLGIATSDLDGDGHTDVFVGGSNRLFLGGDTRFTEVVTDVFAWETYGNEDDVAGAAIADLNRDGRPDLVIGHHFNSTLDKDARVPVRVYLNEGSADGLQFTDVTAGTGLPGLPTKAPHVEIADVDNDGWPDIVTSASAADGTAPAVFRHLGLDASGVPVFDTPTGLGSPQYWVTGPTADVDRDGRLDLLLVEWEPSLPSKLMMNASETGNWLEVSVGVGAGIPAVGTVVHVWEAGAMDDPARLVGMREIVASQGYAAGGLQVAHFGLGDRTSVDVRVTLVDGRTIDLAATPANQHLRVPDGCPP